MATSPDGTRIAWYRYGAGEQSALFVPTWNIVDARVVGHQVAALAQHATVVTYDARGVGASDRPPSGYDFPFHAADALAVMDATGLEHAAVVTASRGLNATILLAAEHPHRVERIAASGVYMRLEPDPPAPDPARVEALRTDWCGFIVPFMHSVFTEPRSEELIAEMIAIGLESSPEVVATQELETDWRRPAALLPAVGCPTLLVYGEDDIVPLSLVEGIASAMPDARVEVIAGGGHRPDIRSPEIVNPVLLDFILASRSSGAAPA
jgi:3-oxoadipate enol-lactonase